MKPWETRAAWLLVMIVLGLLGARSYLLVVAVLAAVSCAAVEREIRRKS